jgi:hypothetical protein
MGRVEFLFFTYVKRRIEEGAPGVSAAEAMRAVVPAEHPEFAQRASYRYALERLDRRYVLTTTTIDGTVYYRLGDGAPQLPMLRVIK